MRCYRYAESVQTFDFSTLYTSIPHDLLKSRISTLIRNSFKKKDGSIRYTYIKVDGRRGYFSNSIDSGGDKTYNANPICDMVEFLIDNIFVKFGGHLFSSGHWNSNGYQMCSPPADLFLYSYESDFLDNMIRSGHWKLARSFNLCFRYIDDRCSTIRSSGNMSKTCIPPNLMLKRLTSVITW